MTQDEMIVLNAVRTFGRGARIRRQSVVNEARLSAERVDKALQGLEASGHVWQDGDIVRLSSDGTTFDT